MVMVRVRVRVRVGARCLYVLQRSEHGKNAPLWSIRVGVDYLTGGTR